MVKRQKQALTPEFAKSHPDYHYFTPEERLQSSKHYATPGDELYQAEQRKLRNGSVINRNASEYVSNLLVETGNGRIEHGGDYQRYIRNEQSQIGKDIKATRREIEKTTNGVERANLERRLETLEQLKEGMKQYREGPTGRVAQSASSRAEAVATYNTLFRGVRNLTEQRETIVPLPPMNKVQNRMTEGIVKSFGVDMEKLESLPGFHTLLAQYETAIRSYNYMEAQIIMRRMKSMAEDMGLIQNYNNMPTQQTAQNK